MFNLTKMVACAKGAIKADLVLKHGSVVNVMTGKITVGDVAVCDDRIVGVGDYEGVTEIDCTGKFVLPGLIDTHLHIESSMLSPREFVRAVLPYGTTSMIIDPHEIANVAGMKGVQYMIDELAPLPINAKVMLPSCVPATPFETAGTVMDAPVIAENIGNAGVYGLGEFMNFVGVVRSDPDTLAKLEAAHESGKIVDGHSMTLSDRELNAYIAAGIRTDHECTTVGDMTERIDRGMYIQLREGCATKNVATLAKGVTEGNKRRCVFCTDDKHVDDLMSVGHINNNLRVAVANGIAPIDAVTIATLNAAECYGLKERGAIIPSYIADFAVVDNLTDFNVECVVYEGKVVARDGKCVFDMPEANECPVTSSVRIPHMTAEHFRLVSKSDKVNVINLVPQNVVTTLGTATVKRDGQSNVLLSEGLVKVAVVERHHCTGNVGLGLLAGYGLKGGAIAQTVAHDSHNLIVMGDSDADMALAANTLAEIGGGLAVVKDGAVLGTLALPIAGLMTELSKEELYAEFDRMLVLARELGISTAVEPFMTMSFLCLPVIPCVRITDRGLFDVNSFAFLPIEAE